MVESSAIIKRAKRVCRGRGREGRCSHHIEVFSSEDVLVEILALMPLKSIFRFKCVSKMWHQLISKDYFRLKIIERNKMDHGPLYFFQATRGSMMRYLCVRTTPELSWCFLAEAKSVTNSNCPSKFGERLKVKVELDVMEQGIGGGGGGDKFRYFICCSNGLLLCFVSHTIDSLPPWTCPLIERPYCRCRSFYQYVTRYYIYNPFTKVGYLLPYSPNQSRREFNSHDETASCPGFGKDCVALVAGSACNYDGYKVVRAQAALSNENIIELETFSSHTGEWQLSTSTVSVATHRLFSSHSGYNLAVHVIKGAIYWMVGIVSFKYMIVYNGDTTDEEEHRPGPGGGGGGGGGVIEIIEAPSDCRNVWSGVGTGESIDGLLQVACAVCNLTYCPDIRIWVYHPHDRSWSRRHQLRVPSLRPDFISLEPVVISFHPLNPNILFIVCLGWVHACHLNTTPMLTEPLVRFKLLDEYVTVHSYLPPLWPISPFPHLPRKK